jgi:hypothetical protein
MSDPNLQSFAVFANSNQAVVKSTSKSVVSIPFQTNLAVHDPQKMLRIALSMVKYTNSVYNIEADRNTLVMAVEFNVGRGFVAGDPGMWQTWTIRIPPGAYDIVELSNLLSQGRYTYDPEEQNAYYNRAGYEVVLQPMVYAAIPADMPAQPGNGGTTTSTPNCFVGFGAIPADQTDPTITKAALSIDNNSKLVFQSPDLSHLIQYETDIHTPCTNKIAGGQEPSELTLDHSYVYKGVYLLFTSNSAPLLKLLGYFNIDSIPAPEVVGYRNKANVLEPMTGYGLTFTSETVYREYPHWTNNILDNPQLPYDPLFDRYAAQNITYYKLNSYQLGGNGVVQFTPQLPLLENFQGHFGNVTTVGETTPFFNVLFQPNTAQNGYVLVSNGYTLSGFGILPPNPQVLGQDDLPFRAICSRTKLDNDNIRWNNDLVGAPANSLLDTEIGIYGVFYDTNPTSVLAPAPMPEYIPLGLQLGFPITFNGDGLGHPEVFLDDAVPGLSTNLFQYIIQDAEWRLIYSGDPGAVYDRIDWIYCIRLTVAPQVTVALPLPARMITMFPTDYADDVYWLEPVADPTAVPTPITPQDTMSYYNLNLRSRRFTVNNPQSVVTVTPTITYTSMVATNVGLNDLSSVLIPKNLTNLEGLDEIHIHCAQLRTKHLSSTSFQALAPGDVIAVVPVDAPFGSKGTWQPPVPLDSFVSNTNIVALDFRLTDSSNRLLDFNGLDWSMVFKCEEVDVMQPNQMAGTINTPFQDQLATMEGTSHAQTRAGRKRAANMAPNEFYEMERRKKMNEYGDKY